MWNVPRPLRAEPTSVPVPHRREGALQAIYRCPSCLGGIGWGHLEMYLTCGREHSRPSTDVPHAWVGLVRVISRCTSLVGGSTPRHPPMSLMPEWDWSEAPGDVPYGGEGALRGPTDVPRTWMGLVQSTVRCTSPVGGITPTHPCISCLNGRGESIRSWVRQPTLDCDETQRSVPGAKGVDDHRFLSGLG